MKKVKKYWLSILLVLCLLGGSFYWFEWRPHQIRIDCANKIIDKAKNEDLSLGASGIDIFLQVCLLKRGISE